MRKNIFEGFPFLKLVEDFCGKNDAGYEALRKIVVDTRNYVNMFDTSLIDIDAIFEIQLIVLEVYPLENSMDLN